MIKKIGRKYHVYKDGELIGIEPKIEDATKLDRKKPGATKLDKGKKKVKKNVK